MEDVKTNLKGNETKDVLLIYPGKYRATEPQIPLSLLYIAGSLMKAVIKHASLT